MRLLAIAGSPRRRGNTDTLLEKFVEGAQQAGAEVKTLTACGLKIEGCRHCDACLAKGRCQVQDDMQGVYRELEEADRIVIASPLQFMSVPSQLKALIDRCQALWARKYILKIPPLGDARERKGFLISVGGRRTIPHLFEAELVTIKTLFRSLDILYFGDLLIPGIEGVGDILKYPEALEKALEEGRRLVEKL
jgi:multimeric flavodoxin WrbA